MTLGGPVFGVVALMMLIALIVVNVVRLRRTSPGRFPVLGVSVAVVVVAVVVGVALAFGRA